MQGTGCSFMHRTPILMSRVGAISPIHKNWTANFPIEFDLDKKRSFMRTLAQLVERMPSKRKVVGSIPAC